MNAASLRQLRTFLRSYRALIHLSWSVMFQYRAAVFIWTFWSLTGPIIHLSVWSSIIRAEGTIAGFTASDIAAYFIVQSIVYHLHSAWHAYEFGYLMRTGWLSSHLLRPFDPSHRFVADNVAFKMINLVWLIPIWAGLIWYFRPAFPLSFERIVAFICTLLLAAILNFLWTHCWAMVSFWTVRADALFDLWGAIAFLLGGGIAPIALLPPALQGVAGYLPFVHMIAAPIEAMVGVVPLAQVWRGTPIALLWIVVLFWVSRSLWRRGLRQYSAVGA